MDTIVVEPGLILGIGGSNARSAVYAGEQIVDFTHVPTPHESHAFFTWVASQMLDAAARGLNWLVVGFPGPVSADGTLVGPLHNIAGLTARQYNLAEELRAAVPAVTAVLAGDFTVIAVNDGDLAAHAVAAKFGVNRYNKVAALIVGTGVGAGIVARDPHYTNVYRSDSSSPLEIGHIPLSHDTELAEDNTIKTIETLISGPALYRTYRTHPHELPAAHAAWERVGKGIGHLTLLLGLMNGVELVAVCGGVGSSASDMYRPYIEKAHAAYKEHGNGPQKLLLPAIVSVPKEEAQKFEMYGGAGVIRDFRTR